MRRGWLVGSVDGGDQFTAKIEVQESSNPDEVVLFVCGYAVSLTRAEWKELCSLEYQVHFAKPVVPETPEETPEIPCPICDGEPGGHGEEPCL